MILLPESYLKNIHKSKIAQFTIFNKNIHSNMMWNCCMRDTLEKIGDHPMSPLALLLHMLAGLLCDEFRIICILKVVVIHGKLLPDTTIDSDGALAIRSSVGALG